MLPDSLQVLQGEDNGSVPPVESSGTAAQVHKFIINRYLAGPG